MQIGLRRRRRLNLATRPFVNERPVKRLAVALSAAALLLTGLNGWLYARHFSGSQLNREQQLRTRERITEERERLRELAAELERLDVAATNQQARYLNLRIAERSFSWSELFDRLAEAMPGNVRLMSLSPDFSDRRRQQRKSGREDETILLEIRASAKTDQALLEFIDRLFGHPRFRRPNLLTERRQEDGSYDFSLEVVYHPAAAAETPPAASEEVAGPTSAPAEAETPQAAAAAGTS